MNKIIEEDKLGNTEELTVKKIIRIPNILIMINMLKLSKTNIKYYQKKIIKKFLSLLKICN